MAPGFAQQGGQQPHAPTKVMSCQKDNKLKIFSAPSGPQNFDLLFAKIRKFGGVIEENLKNLGFFKFFLAILTGGGMVPLSPNPASATPAFKSYIWFLRH